MYVAIRVRGKVKVNEKLEYTMKLLRLNRVNHAALVPETKKNMLEKVRGYITFGEIDKDTLAKVMEKKSRFPGHKKIDAKWMEKNKFKSFDELADAILAGKKLEEFGLKPIFRLSPPKKGYERAGIKKDFNIGGALGYRAGDINRLIRRMI